MTVSLMRLTASSRPGNIATASLTSAERLTVILPRTFRLPAGAVLAGFRAPSMVSHTLPSTPSSGGSPSILRSSAESRSSPLTGSSRSVQKTVALHCMNENGSSCTSQVVSESLRRRA